MGRLCFRSKTLYHESLELFPDYLVHSFDELVALCRPDAYVLLLGPSAPLTPVLFDTGIDAISGTRIIDAERVLYTLSQGANFRQIKRGGGLKLLTMFKR